MGLQPNIQRKNKFTLKKCSKCGQMFGPESFAPTKSVFYPDGVIPLCNDCVNTLIDTNEFKWNIVNKICQMADIPFVPKEWERLAAMDVHDVFYRYATIFESTEYEGLDWSTYNEAFLKLKRQQDLESELPLLAEDRRKKLKEKWGKNYDDEALQYLEGLFNGLLSTQNVNGALQIDQALKLCKMSYEIDERIAGGEDFDKLLSSYDKLVKSAEFTPKNAKNINDFDTAGEMTKWMEKRGWRNTFYDGESRDIVDETLKNFENFNQRLYTNESNIAEQIEQRIKNLQSAADMENYYDTDKSYDLDAFERDGLEQLFSNESDEFVADLSRDGGDADDEE